MIHDDRKVTDGAYTNAGTDTHTRPTGWMDGSDNSMHRARNIEWLQRKRIIAHMFCCLLQSRFPFFAPSSCFVCITPVLPKMFIAISPSRYSCDAVAVVCVVFRPEKFDCLWQFGTVLNETIFSQVRRFKRNRREKRFLGSEIETQKPLLSIIIRTIYSSATWTWTN